MTAVIDTNVVAYLLLGTERFVAESRRFMSAVSQGLAPAVWEAHWRALSGWRFGRAC